MPDLIPVSTLEVIPYGFLAAAVVFTMLCRGKAIIIAAMIAACVAAFFSGNLEPNGLALLAGFWGLTYVGSNCQSSHPVGRAAFFCLMMAFGLALMLHGLPGFENPVLLEKVQISPQSRPFTMYLSFEKIFVGLVFCLYGDLFKGEKVFELRALGRTTLILLGCIVAILGPALLTGYVRLDPKLSSHLPVWALNNFVFVCFAEEVFFRGMLQGSLAKVLPRDWRGTLLALIIASAVFGLCHYRGGIIYVVLAAVCGLFYGYAYHRTGKLLCAMLVHFGLNLFHFVMFTYPAVERLQDRAS